MCVPGAMAAMSAAMVIRNPADAARFPDGPTNTATGVFAWMMALLMSRVESTSPPGVRSVIDHERGLVGVRLRDHPADIFGGDRMDDPVDLGGVDDEAAVDACARELAPARSVTPAR